VLSALDGRYYSLHARHPDEDSYSRLAAYIQNDVTRIAPSWLSSAVIEIARSARKEQDFSALPVLADALEERGCTERDILGHCRTKGQHFRGCWVVDLILESAKVEMEGTVK
jgi:hypothetical protein